MIKVHPEKAEHLNALQRRMFQSARATEIAEARLNIAKGRQTLARIRFWDVAESIAQELRDASGYRWDAIEKAFFLQGGPDAPAD